MEIQYRDSFGNGRVGTVSEAVEQRLADDNPGHMATRDSVVDLQARCSALENMIANLVEVLVSTRTLRSTDLNNLLPWGWEEN